MRRLPQADRLERFGRRRASSRSATRRSSSACTAARWAVICMRAISV